LDKGKVLGILLSLLSLMLVVVPILAAFSAHGWDPVATVMSGSTPFENMANLNVSENMFSVSEPTQGPNNTLVFNAQFTSPVNFSMKIKSISGEGFADSTPIGSIQLANEVEFPPNATRNFSIICTPTQAGLNYIANYAIQHGGSLPEISPKNMRLSIDIYGITIEGTFD
jgi:hypothetical protein